MNLTFRQAELSDLELLTELRTEFLRLANNFDEYKDMSEVKNSVYSFYESSLENGTHVAYNETLARRRAGLVKRNYPEANIICFKGKGHCEDSILNPDAMLKELDRML